VTFYYHQEYIKFEPLDKLFSFITWWIYLSATNVQHQILKVSLAFMLELSSEILEFIIEVVSNLESLHTILFVFVAIDAI